MKRTIICLALCLAACEEATLQDFAVKESEGNLWAADVETRQSLGPSELRLEPMVFDFSGEPEWPEPRVDIDCELELPALTCSENAHFGLTCRVRNWDDRERTFGSVFLSFADEGDRESCGFDSVDHNEGLRLDSGEQELLTEVEVICTEMPSDGRLDLSFGLLAEFSPLDKVWFYDLEFESFELGPYFETCEPTTYVEGWQCSKAEGYPLWISSLGGSFQLLDSSSEMVLEQAIPDDGFTINFDCEDLPAVVLVDGDLSIDALAYGHDLEDFSVWWEYDEEITLMPNRPPDLNMRELDMSEDQTRILIRVPALPLM